MAYPDNTTSAKTSDDEFARHVADYVNASLNGMVAMLDLVEESAGAMTREPGNERGSEPVERILLSLVQMYPEVCIFSQWQLLGATTRKQVNSLSRSWGEVKSQGGQIS